LELIDGFDPGLLSEAAAPVPDARPWQWLADPDRTEDEILAYDRRFVVGFGTVDPSDLDLRLEPRSRAEVIAGHLAQQVFLELPDGSTVVLQPAAAATAGGGAPAAGFAFRGPVAIIGTTVPAEAAAQAVGVSVGQSLTDLLVGRAVQCWQALAVDPGREWIDPAVIAPAAAITAVTMAAASHWQPFLTVWRPDITHPFGVLEVVELGGQAPAPVVATAPAVLQRLSAHPCPMIPGARPGELCRKHGGPWVSRSIRAAMRWEERRARMIRALGCDTCGDGAITLFNGRVLGGRRQAIPVRPDVSAPTRHDRLVNANPDSDR
jgi:hypothetical protein